MRKVLLALGISALYLITSNPAHARLSENASAALLAGKSIAREEPEAAAIEADPRWRSVASRAALMSFWNKEMLPGRGTRNLLSPSSVALMRQFASKQMPEAYAGTRRVLYLFGGPDFPYPNAFFPQMEELVLVGLEDVGDLPDVEAAWRAGSLPGLMQSIASAYIYLPYDSYFITKKMAVMLQRFGISTMLAVGVVATGNEITGIDKIDIDQSGAAVPASSPARAKGVRISYRKPDGQAGQVIYLKQNLSNASMTASPAFERFLRNQRFDLAFYKAASFVSHYTGEFSHIDQFVLDEARFIVQTDDGLPFRLLSADPARWQIRLFGYYGPSPALFASHHQPDLLNEYAVDLCALRDPNASRDYSAVWGTSDICGRYAGRQPRTRSEWGGLLPFPYGYDSTMSPVPARLRSAASNLLYAKSTRPAEQ